MQVALLEDVKALGKKGQIVNVNDGYTRNFISPKKLGMKANSKNLNDLKPKGANDNRVAVEQLAAAKELGIKPDESSVTLTIKAGEGGRAFGSVSFKEVGKVIGDQLGVDIDKRKIVLNDPIEPIGSFEVSVRLRKGVTVRLAVRVVGAQNYSADTGPVSMNGSYRFRRRR